MKCIIKAGYLVVALVSLGWLILPPQVQRASATGTWFVSNSGNDGNDCATPATPCASIGAALNKPGFVAGDTVDVAIGKYTGTGNEVVSLSKNATLSGGWNLAFTTQDGMSTLDGQGARRVIAVPNGVVATIDQFTMENGYTDSGAGLLNEGTLVLTRSLLTKNSVSSPNGYAGGIMNTGTLTISASAVISNTAYGGGGIANYGTLVLNNSTVSSNYAYFGAGIVSMVPSSRIYIDSSTITKNTATTGGGTASNVGNVTYFLKNSILAGNSTPNGYVTNCHQGGVSSLGYTLTQGCGNLGGPGDIVDVDPMLGDLDGVLPYHYLLPNSPAIDAGDPAGCTDYLGNPLLTDQRGFLRTGRCDIGAVESRSIDPSAKTVDKTTANAGDTVAYIVTVRNGGAANMPNVLVTDTLPLELSYVNNSLAATSGTYVYNSGVITWNGPVNPSNIVTITFRAKISPIIPLGDSLRNTVWINDNGTIVSRVAATRVLPRYTFLPMTLKPAPPFCTGICGRVTLNGSMIQLLPIDLRYYNGSTWSTIARSYTDGNGIYSFTNMPSLISGQKYYARFTNDLKNSNYLSSWTTRVLTTYVTGNTELIGDFDIGNIPLISPSPGATVALPSKFQWGVRSATPSDSYEFNLFDPNNPSLEAWTPPLGYVNSYTLNGLPSGFVPSVWYGWYVAVYSPDGGYGTSYYYRTVTFLNTGSAPLLRIPSKAQQMRDDWHGAPPVLPQAK